MSEGRGVMKHGAVGTSRRCSVQPHVQNLTFGASPPAKVSSPSRPSPPPRRRRHDPSALVASTQSVDDALTLGEAFPAGSDREGKPLPVRGADEWALNLDQIAELLGSSVTETAERERLTELHDALRVAVDGWSDYIRLREDVTRHLGQLGEVDKVRFDEELRRCQERQRDIPCVTARTAVRELDTNAAARTLVTGRRRVFGAEEKLSDELRRWQARVAWDSAPAVDQRSPSSACSSIVYDTSGSLAKGDRSRRGTPPHPSDSSPQQDWCESGVTGGDTFFMSSLVDDAGEMTVTGESSNIISDEDAYSLLPPLESTETPRSSAETFMSLRTPACMPEDLGRSWGMQSDGGSALENTIIGPKSPACSCPSPRVTGKAKSEPNLRPSTACVVRPDPPMLPQIESVFAVTQRQHHDVQPQRGAVSASQLKDSLVSEVAANTGGCELETDTRRMLGRGAHGEVYVARLRHAGGMPTEVAVKCVRVTDRRTRALILRELELWCKVSASPQIVKYFHHQYNRATRTYSIAMELCRYGSMQDLVNRVGCWRALRTPWRADGVLDRENLDELYRESSSCVTSESGTVVKQSAGSCTVSCSTAYPHSPLSRSRSRPGSARDAPRVVPLPDATVRRFMSHVVRGVAFVHSMNVIHRDVKPSNILLAYDGSVKLCDFGVSAQLRGASSVRHTLVGTLGFLAPEVIQEQPYTTAADIWSLGCTAMEALTGRRPYQDLPACAVLFRTVQDTDCPLSAAASAGLTDDAVNFIRSCLKRAPQARPSAQEAINHPFASSQPEPLIE